MLYEVITRVRSHLALADHGLPPRVEKLHRILHRDHVMGRRLVDQRHQRAQQVTDRRRQQHIGAIDALLLLQPAGLHQAAIDPVGVV